MLSRQRTEAVAAQITEDIARESAASLGRSGHLVEESLKRLRAPNLGEAERERRLKAAVEAVYYYFIQRELMGTANHQEAIALYDIPDEVLKRLGAC